MLALNADTTAALRRALEKDLYDLAKGHLTKEAGTPEVSYSLSGRLYLSQSGWLLLSVPNAVVRGLFDALHEPGIELPLREGKLNAHISVMSAEDVEALGGPDKISERGHLFTYGLGSLKSVRPSTWDGVSRVWFVTVVSPELQALRRSYGLSSLPKDGKHEFHLTVAIKRSGVLERNDVSKAAGLPSVLLSAKQPRWRPVVSG